MALPESGHHTAVPAERPLLSPLCFYTFSSPRQHLADKWKRGSIEGNYPFPQVINVQMSFSGERDKNECAIFRNQLLNYKHKAQFYSPHNVRIEKKAQGRKRTERRSEHTSGRCQPRPRLGYLDLPGQGFFHVRCMPSIFVEQITQRVAV